MTRVAALLASLALAACARRPPDRPQATEARDAGAHASTIATLDLDASSSAPAWREVRPQLVKEIASAQEPLRAFALGREVLVARAEGDRFRVARLENDTLVDEDAWSKGLPVAQKSRGKSPFSCSRIDAIFGRFPDRVWLIVNSGGSMECSSTFGEYTVWHRVNGAWAKDVTHSPPAGKMVGGIFATWPLADGLLGTGLSNLVGDTLTAPLDAMWTREPDPFATRVHLAPEGASVLAACASARGTIAALSAKDGHIALTTIQPDKSKATIAVPSPHVPEGPCAVTDKQLLLVQPPATRGARETWLSFDPIGRTWTPVAVPWPHRTQRLDFVGSRVLAQTTDADAHTHLFLGAEGASSWAELVGVPGTELELVAVPSPDKLLLRVDGTKVVAVGLP
jgi:hypothetical protein